MIEIRSIELLQFYLSYVVPPWLGINTGPSETILCTAVPGTRY